MRSWQGGSGSSSPPVPPPRLHHGPPGPADRGGRPVPAGLAHRSRPPESVYLGALTSPLPGPARRPCATSSNASTRLTAATPKSEGFFDLTAKEKRLAELESRQADPGFWSRGDEARLVVQELKELKAWITPEADITRRIGDVRAMVELLEAEPDDELATELAREIELVEKSLESFEL